MKTKLWRTKALNLGMELIMNKSKNMSAKHVTILLLLISISSFSFCQVNEIVCLKFQKQTSIPFYYSAPNINDAIDSCAQSGDSLFCFIFFRDSIVCKNKDDMLLSVYVNKYYINKKKYSLTLSLPTFKTLSIKEPKYIIINNTDGIWRFKLFEKKSKNTYLLKEFERF